MPRVCTRSTCTNACQDRQTESKLARLFPILLLLGCSTSWLYNRTLQKASGARKMCALDGRVKELQLRLIVLKTAAVDRKNWQDVMWKSMRNISAKSCHLGNEFVEDIVQKTEKLFESLREVTKVIRNYTDEEFLTYSADKIGKPDFAYEGSGGTVLTIRDTEGYEPESPTTYKWGPKLCRTDTSPQSMLRAYVLPGECWAISGNKAVAVIQLMTCIMVDGLSLEHAPASISPFGDQTDAPREVSLWGLQNPDDQSGFYFGSFKYEVNTTALQYFRVKHSSPSPYSIVEFRVHSNHGNPLYTCVYRLRVHGTLQTS